MATAVGLLARLVEEDIHSATIFKGLHRAHVGHAKHRVQGFVASSRVGRINEDLILVLMDVFRHRRLERSGRKGKNDSVGSVERPRTWQGARQSHERLHLPLSCLVL